MLTMLTNLLAHALPVVFSACDLKRPHVLVLENLFVVVAAKAKHRRCGAE